MMEAYVNLINFYKKLQDFPKYLWNGGTLQGTKAPTLAYK